MSELDLSPLRAQLAEFAPQGRAANLLTIDALDPQALIPEYKACAVQIAPVREQDLPSPESTQARSRY